MEKVLIIEDEKLQNAVLKTMLSKQLNYDAVQTYSAEEALTALDGDEQKSISLIIMDLGLPDVHGLDFLDTLRDSYPHLPVIILTASEDRKDAVIAIRKGAIDFLNKPPQVERLAVSIDNALKIKSLSTEITKLQRSQKEQSSFSNLIGHDGDLKETIKRAKTAAQSTIPVLITGETGVGKEVFAQAIHLESERKDKPFIAINCGAIPKHLVESTLFGHEKGAFTGAVEKTIGKFREAEGGTIFLDEIGELPLETQVKLLRALQQNEIEPVGSSINVPINVRIISATNRNLAHEVQQNTFREDLFFRLEGLPLTIPALRFRKKDIKPLIKHFLEQYAHQEGLIGKSLSREAETFLSEQNWPGNVRELQHTIHRSILLSSGQQIHLTDVLSSMSKQQHSSTNESTIDPNTVIQIINGDTIKTLEEIEQEAMEKVMAFYKGNVTKTSYNLDIAKSTFYRKWKKQHN